MPHPLSDFPTYTACLAGVSRVNIRHHKSGTISFVGRKVLQLPKRPPMESGSYPVTGFDVVTNMGKVLQSDFSGSGSYGFRDNGFTDFMVNVLHMPLFAPRDSVELAFCSSTTVGLKTTAMGKIAVPLMTKGSTTKHLASAGSGEIIFSNINTHRSTANRRSVRDIETQVKVPDAFTNNNASVFGCTRRQQVSLVPTIGKWNQDTSIQRKQAHSIGEQTIGAFVIVDGCWGERNDRNRLVFDDATIGFESFVRIGNPMYRLAHHLTAQRGKQLSHWVVAQVVQCNAIPHPVRDNHRYDLRTCATKRISQRSQSLGLFWAGQELKGCRAITHIGKHYRSAMQSQDALPTSPEWRGLSRGLR